MRKTYRWKSDIPLFHIYIRDEAGNVIGLLKANVDITDLLAMQETIAKELFFSYDSYSDFRQVLPDAMAVSSESVINDFIENALTTLGYMDIQKLKKDDKMRIVSYLNELNAFSLKGAVEIVAKSSACQCLRFIGIGITFERCDG